MGNHLVAETPEAQPASIEAEKTAGLLVAVFEKLEVIERKLSSANAPTTWSAQEIGAWLGLSKYTVSQSVVVRPGFPQPIVPGGVQGGEKRWFADEVIEWFRLNRGALPKGRSSTGRPRGRPRSRK